MSMVTCDLSVSLDGFAAGPRQSAKLPLGVGEESLHRWMFEQPDENTDALEAILATDGIASALSQARDAAGDGNVGIAGGADVVRQYLSAGLIDQLRLHTASVLLGAGERLFDGVENVSLEPVNVTGNGLVTHSTYRVVR